MIILSETPMEHLKVILNPKTSKKYLNWEMTEEHCLPFSLEIMDQVVKDLIYNGFSKMFHLCFTQKSKKW